MVNKKFDVIVIGAGLGGLSAAARLKEESESLKVAIVSSGKGATPLVAALNAVISKNPYGDTPEQHIKDMLEAGYQINDIKLVSKMCYEAERCVHKLEDWGVEFAKKDDNFHLRHASGSKYPRSLCATTQLIGKNIVSTLIKYLEERGVVFFDDTLCTELYTKNNKIYGIEVKSIHEKGYNGDLYAPVVISAWGGVGNLFPGSTYPEDIDGRSLAMAYDAGASLVDLEFIEFEPMVTIWPKEAKGEPCPTAMLGEGGYLLNSNHERFLLKKLPEGEAGATKSIINEAIKVEFEKGTTSPHGGVYADLRHISVDTLKDYPWFYNRLKKSGLDPAEELIEVGPMPHSHSGGIYVDKNYQSEIEGLFAVGEAAGGIHGACRLAGNAAAQAMVSGILAGEKIIGNTFDNKDNNLSHENPDDCNFDNNTPIVSEIQTIMGESLGLIREEKKIKSCISKLERYLSETKNNKFVNQFILSGLLVAKSSFLRKESRGTHSRKDYPELSEDWNCSIKINSKKDSKEWEKIPRTVDET